MKRFATALFLVAAMAAPALANRTETKVNVPVAEDGCSKAPEVKKFLLMMPMRPVTLTDKEGKEHSGIVIVVEPDSWVAFNESVLRLMAWSKNCAK